MMTEKIDILIKQARVFNNGEKPLTQDIAIRDGRIVKRAETITDEAIKIIDANGLWAMPGLFDIHTHYDLELEVAPGLPESTRHGTTSVVIANCSLGLAFGAQRSGDIDPIVDCYARVENIPKTVLRDCADKVTWNSPSEYLEHIDQLNLGPNVVTMIPHSMLRIEVMGFNESISRDPTDGEVVEMQKKLRDGLKIGYAGFSTDALPFHYLANQPNCHKTIPTQFAKYKEIKQLTQIVREEEMLWQGTPPKDSPFDVFKTFLLSCGRLHGKPLKTTIVAALDVTNNRTLIILTKLLSKIINSKFMHGEFYLQALGARFKVWADGAVTPLSEEIPELRALNETDLEDRAGRQKILQDPEYITAFRQMWLKGKQGWNIDRLKRSWRLEDYAFSRDIAKMHIDVCPLQDWQGLTFEQAFNRVLDSKRGALKASENEIKIIESDFFWVHDEADFVIQMLRTFDIKLSWSTVTANEDQSMVRDLLMNPTLLPGFNDSGAHLTNMAFYDVNLRSLKLAYQGGEEDVSFMVKRLTKDPANVFGVEGGTIYEGDIADLILVDPKNLEAYEGEDNIQRVHREEYQHEQLVNRSDGVVPLVLINGQIAWQNNQFGSNLGKTKMGRLLKPVSILRKAN